MTTPATQPWTEVGLLRRRLQSGDRILGDLAAVATTTDDDDLDDVFAATAALSRRELVDAVVSAAHTIAVASAPRRPGRRLRHQWVAELAPRPSLGPRLYEDEAAWSDDELRAAHTAVRAGSTDARHAEGERIYQRLCKRTRRRAEQASA